MNITVSAGPEPAPVEPEAPSDSGSDWWGSLWGGFGMNTSLATGLMLVPLLIGIGLLFFLDRKWIGWVVTAIGLLAILVTLLTSVRFRPVSASLWQYVVMFGMIAAGCGLVARGLLKSRD